MQDKSSQNNPANQEQNENLLPKNQKGLMEDSEMKQTLDSLKETDSNSVVDKTKINKNNSGFFTTKTIGYIPIEIGVFNTVEDLEKAIEFAKFNIKNNVEWIFKAFISKDEILNFIELDYENERIINELGLVFSSHHNSIKAKKKLFNEIDKLRK